MQTKSGRERIFCVRFPSVGFLLTTSHLKRDTWSIKSFYYSINTLFVEPQLDGILEKCVFENVKNEYSTMLKIYHLVVHLNAFNSAISQGNWLLKDQEIMFYVIIGSKLIFAGCCGRRLPCAIFGHVHSHLNYYKYII